MATSRMYAAPQQAVSSISFLVPYSLLKTLLEYVLRASISLIFSDTDMLRQYSGFHE